MLRLFRAWILPTYIATMYGGGTGSQEPAAGVIGSLARAWWVTLRASNLFDLGCEWRSTCHVMTKCFGHYE
jgi:hypothetical protein